MHFAELTGKARAELVKQANARYRCKDDLYDYLDKMLVSSRCLLLPHLSFVQHVELPSKSFCTLNFLQQLTREEKTPLSKGACRRYKVPNLPELSIKRMWPEALKDRTFLKFMPDEWEGGKRVDRTFFWHVLTTLQPEYVDALIEDCRKQRRE